MTADQASSSVDDRTRGRDRALIRAGASGAGARVITVIIGVIAVSVAVRALGDVQYGVVATLATVVGLVGFADLGVGSGLLSRMATAHGRDDRQAMKVAVSSAWTTLWALAFGLMIIGFVALNVLPWQTLLGAPDLSSSQINAAVAVFVVCAALAIPFGVGQRILVGLQQGATANLWAAAAAASALVGVVIASLLGGSMAVFVGATLGMPVLVAGVETAVVLSRLHADLRPRLHLVSRASVTDLASVSGLYLVLNMAVSVAYQSDALIVASLLGAGSAAVFAVTLRMFGLVSGLFTGAITQMWPAMTEALERGELAWVRSRFGRVLGLTLALTSVGSLILVVFGRLLVRLWVGEGLVPPLSLLIAFAAWTIYSLAMSQCSMLLNAAHVVAPQVVMAVLMASANIALSIWFTQQWGIVGPLVGSLIAHVIFAGVPTIVLVRRVLDGRLRGTVAAPAPVAST